MASAGEVKVSLGGEVGVKLHVDQVGGVDQRHALVHALTEARHILVHEVGGGWHEGVDSLRGSSKLLVSVGEGAPLLVGAGLSLFEELALNSFEVDLVVLLVSIVLLEHGVVLSSSLVTLEVSSMAGLCCLESALVAWGVLELTHVLCNFNLVGRDGVIGVSEVWVTVSKVALFAHLASSVLLEVAASRGLVFVVDWLLHVHYIIVIRINKCGKR